MRTRFETSAGVFIRDNKMLLGKRPLSKDNYPGLWDVPAGHLEENETPEQALVREVKEELNVDVVNFKHVHSYEETDSFSKRRYKHNIFIVTKWSGEINFFEEMETFGWFSFDEAGKMDKTFSNELLQKVFK